MHSLTDAYDCISPVKGITEAAIAHIEAATACTAPIIAPTAAEKSHTEAVTAHTAATTADTLSFEPARQAQTKRRIHFYCSKGCRPSSLHRLLNSGPEFSVFLSFFYFFLPRCRGLWAHILFLHHDLFSVLRSFFVLVLPLYLRRLRLGLEVVVAHTETATAHMAAAHPTWRLWQSR